MKRALITGITGQDGSYLAEFLLDKGYQVFGLVRRVSTPINWRIEHLLDKITLIEGDMHDQGSLVNAVNIAQPDEVYNLAAQSFVGTSWKQTELTGQITGLGTVRMLEAVKIAAPKAKFYQASSSEMYGNATESIQDEQTKFRPRSPYATSKLFAHWSAVNYRESYNMFVCSGILFNHESPRRGIEFVTRKITDGVARIKLGLADSLSLGSLDAKRDWGYAGDYVEAMWLMLQQEQPEDFVISTGETHSVQDFVVAAFKEVGIENWQDYVKQDPRFMRPAELFTLQGSSEKALKKLGWKPKVNFQQLVGMMVQADLERLNPESKNKEISNEELGGKETNKKSESENIIEKSEQSVAQEIAENKQGEKWLITGSSGFVGKVITNMLRERGQEVYGFDRLGEEEDVFKVDILDKETVAAKIAEIEPDYIVHLAAQSSVGKSWEKPELTRQVNVQGTVNILQAVVDAGLNENCKILIVSSAEIYGKVQETPITEEHPLNPQSPYGISRLEQEQVVEKFIDENNLKITIARSFPHTGKQQKPLFVCPSFVKQVAELEKSNEENKEMIVGNLEAVRDFTNVIDVCKAYIKLLENDVQGTFNICSGQGVKISEIVELLKQKSSIEFSVKQNPEWMRPNDIPVLIGDNNKLKQAVDWQPEISFSETIQDMLDYWRGKV